MVARVGLLLRALPLLLWDRLDAQPTERGGQELRKEAEAFLEKYGYLNEQVPKAPTSTRFSDAIRAFQWVSQLPVSGMLDRATVRQMTRPRCGVADTNSYAAWAERISDLFARHRTKMRRKKRFAKQGGALAHAFLPRRGEAHFDQDERWSLSRRRGRNLFVVLAHEIGHTLGLTHSPAPRALMAPYYKRLGRDALLSWDDVLAVQSLYGKPLGGSVAVQLPGKLFTDFEAWDSHSSQGRRPETQGPKYCHSSFDAITVDRQQRLYIFKGSHFWEVAPDGNVSEPRPLQERWIGLPPNIEAAAVSLEDGDFYFFKGGRCWRFRGPKPVWGLPQLCRAGGLPHHPDAALFFPPLRRLILFKGARYYVLAQGGLQVEPYYPRSLQDWGGIPEEVSGALPRPDGSIIFFRDDRYWRLDQAKLQATTSGRWGTELPWMGCWHANSGSTLF
ncbi:matrix metalloproteinase-28 isoform X2 [Rhinopithecus roxellana]|uniref:matrix metalloproteinase-28 isoform X2 n=1 Tax=Rhinopithecus roxellana TaxID=61622 RepID=UPI00123733B4|nr:matrix metalloproteinase-28 isoform X2 [Rhinopithecus roxellana]